MAKKITQKEFIERLITAAGCKSDEAFGLIFGVSKSAVGLWKNGKSPIPLEKFLATFGKETLDWIRQEYNLEYNPEDVDYAEAGRLIGAGIQKLMEIRKDSVVKAETFKQEAISSSAQLSSAEAAINRAKAGRRAPKFTQEEIADIHNKIETLKRQQ